MYHGKVNQNTIPPQLPHGRLENHNAVCARAVGAVYCSAPAAPDHASEVGPKRVSDMIETAPAYPAGATREMPASTPHIPEPPHEHVRKGKEKAAPAWLACASGGRPTAAIAACSYRRMCAPRIQARPSWRHSRASTPIPLNIDLPQKMLTKVLPWRPRARGGSRAKMLDKCSPDHPPPQDGPRDGDRGTPAQTHENNAREHFWSDFRTLAAKIGKIWNK